jgi:hypothetical protein
MLLFECMSFAEAEQMLVEPLRTWLKDPPEYDPEGWAVSIQIAQVEPFHVAAFVHDLQEELSPPSVKQHLAAIRMLFDWLVTGHVIDTNPARSVRGSRYTVKKRQDAGPDG